jgi:hypothetical protein
MENHDVAGWELAFAVMIHAQIAHVLGDRELHASLYAEAQMIVDGTQDAGDKEVLLLTWVNIPAP